MKSDENEFRSSEDIFREIRKLIVKMLKRMEEALNDRSAKLGIIENSKLIRELNISERTAENWRNCGWLPFSKIGNKIFYRISDIEGLLEKMRHNG